MRIPTAATVTAAFALAFVAAEATADAQGPYPQIYPPPGVFPPGTYPPQPYPPQPGGQPPGGQPPPGGYQPPPGGYPPGGQPPPGQNPPWTTPPSLQPPPGQPPPAAPPSKDRSYVEIGTLYGTSAAWGAGMGIWFDAEAGIDDPGLRFVAPVAMGLAAPVGVFFADRYSTMPKGMPAAISAGLLIGGGEGIGIWALQFTSESEANAWGFKGLSRSMALGSTLGGGAGIALAYYGEPSPKTSVLLASSCLWGAVIGSMVDYGATPSSPEKSQSESFGDHNEGAALGGLVGYNVGLGAAAAVSAFYVPSWTQIGFMWVGGGIGAAAGLPIYLAYANSDKPAKRGLIFQGITTGLGIAAGAIFSSGSGYKDVEGSENEGTKPKFAQVTGFGLMPVNGGAGLQMMGILF